MVDSCRFKAGEMQHPHRVVSTPPKGTSPRSEQICVCLVIHLNPSTCTILADLLHASLFPRYTNTHTRSRRRVTRNPNSQQYLNNISLSQTIGNSQPYDFLQQYSARSFWSCQHGMEFSEAENLIEGCLGRRNRKWSAEQFRWLVGLRTWRRLNREID